MLLASLDLELGTLSTMLRYFLGFMLLGIAIISGIIPLLGNALKPKKKTTDSSNVYTRKDTNRSSDTPPPEGFSAHLEIIEQTAPNADASVWWDYAKAEMTEAEVAIAEAKLARKPGTGDKA